MKQKLLTRLILGAFAGVTMIGAVQAGQITASSTNIAREVIVADDQSIVSPSISYRFAGDVNATVNVQEFQVQFTLEDGANWGSTLPSDDAFNITPTAGTNAGLVGVGGTDFAITAKGFNDINNRTVLWATISVPVAPVGAWTTSLLDQPIITLNASGATTPAQITKLKTLVGDIVADYTADNSKCSDNKSLFVNFKHFKLLSNPNAIAAEGTNGIGDEHTRGGTDRAGIVNFPTNILVKLAASGGQAQVNSAGGNTDFRIVALPTAGLSVDAAGVGAGFTTNLVNLGSVDFDVVATGYDANLTNIYASSFAAFGATAAAINGPVEAAKAEVTVTASQGFQVGGNLRLASNAACNVFVSPAVTITAANAAGPIVLAPALAASLAAPMYVCYTAVGTNQIPASSFEGVGRLFKSANGLVAPAYNNEQDNVCKGPLHTLSGGIKIDVRNYASSADTTGWVSVIRLINNSESTTADVYGQLIHSDGTYGPYGKLTDLAPRAVLNLTAKQIDALLTNAPAAGAANGDAAPKAYGNEGAPRLRITSEKGTTLRVQNYMVNPATGAVMEFSSSQGVDFDGSALRGAGEGQYISQDAQRGLNGK